MAFSLAIRTARIGKSEKSPENGLICSDGLSGLFLIQILFVLVFALDTGDATASCQISSRRFLFFIRPFFYNRSQLTRNNRSRNNCSLKQLFWPAGGIV